MEEVEHVCDHVTIIHEGTIVAAGSPDELGTADDAVEVRCADSKAAAGALTGLDGVSDIDVVSANTLLIRGPRVKASQINQFLIERGIPVEQVLRRRESLEQVFFRLTGTSQEMQSK
jgi:ABC-2 type transport system ATP-binding protein